MIYHHNKRFQIFLLHLASKHTYWVKDECGIISHFKHEEVGQIDLMLREYLHNIDTDTLESSKEFMQIFNVRYLVLGL